MCKFLFLIFLLISKSVFALPCGYFDVSVEWLSFLSAIDQPYYVIEDPAEPVTAARRLQLERTPNQQRWKSGYRFQVGYVCEGAQWGLWGRWTHVPEATLQAEVTEGSMWQTLNPPANKTGYQQGTNADGSAMIQDHIEYFSGELGLTRGVMCCSYGSLDVFVGVQYAHIRFDENVDYVANVILDPGAVLLNPIQFESSIDAIGPEIGTEFTFDFYYCVGLLARAQGAVLAARRSAEIHTNPANANPEDAVQRAYNIKDETYWGVIPTVGCRLALLVHENSIANGWRWYNCIRGIEMELGYEFLTYYNGINRMYYYSVGTPGSSTNQYMDLMYHGPYVKLGVAF